MPIRKIARIVGDAQRDAAVARRTSNDPDFRAKVQQDRRGTLSRFNTVKAALADRERIEKAKAAKKKGAKG